MLARRMEMDMKTVEQFNQAADALRRYEQGGRINTQKNSRHPLGRLRHLAATIGLEWRSKPLPHDLFPSIRTNAHRVANLAVLANADDDVAKVREIERENCLAF